MRVSSALIQTGFFLTCVWLRNPASGRLECSWRRADCAIERREIMSHFALAA